MSHRSITQFARIQEDLACLRCGYNLRGLSAAGHAGSSRLTCPECGNLSELADLIVHKWRGSRYPAPGISRVESR